MKIMIPSRLRRIRVLGTILLGVVMLYAWSKNIGYTDPAAYKKGLVANVGAGASVGGGAVLRNGVQEAPLQRPPTYHPPPPPPPPPLPPAAAEPEQPQSPPLPPSPPENIDREQAVPGQPKPTPTTTTQKVAGDKVDKATKPTPPPSALGANHHDQNDNVEQDDEEQEVAASSTSSESPLTTVVPHWSKASELFPVSSTIQLPTGTSLPFPRIQRATEKLSRAGADEDRLAMIKAATLHSWKGYKQFAFGKDEVVPVAGGAHEAFNGWGATLVDALDTLWIMGFKDDFHDAVEQVGKIDFTTSTRSDIPLFETVIRYLGGLVAAYDVSGKQYRTLLDKAAELGEVLYGAFDTPNRAPMTYYNWKPEYADTPRRASSRIVLAEIGTLSMEFTRLAQLTGEPKYYDAVARLTDMLEEWQNHTSVPGIWPLNLDGSGCGPVPVESVENSPPKQSQKQLPNTNAIPPGITLDSQGLRGLGQPGDLDEPDVKHHAELPANPEAHGNVLKRKRQLEEDLSAIDDSLELIGNVEEADDTLDLRAPPNAAPRISKHERCAPQGLVSPVGTQDKYTLAGGTDSMFEYLPKEYMLLGGHVEKYRTMYLESMEVAIDKLLYKPMTEDERDILMSGQLVLRPNYSQPVDERGVIEDFDAEVAHLACFAGGMFAMGGVIFDRPEHVDIGRKITEGCVWAYNVTATGIMPEAAIAMRCEDTWGECKWNESAWWNELDPYSDSRAPAAQKSVVLTPNPPHNSMPQIFEAESAYHPKSNSDVAHDPNFNPRVKHPTKRQLEEPPSDNDDEAEAKTSSTSTSSATASSSASATPSFEDSWTPAPPLTHEDYVTKKIEDQRLPPGFTRFSDRKYILRPEAIESVFYMYRITGDSHWREVGWNMWTAINKYTRAPYGFSALYDVSEAENPTLTDSMESFWLAETLKYFYLLYDDPARWSLDDWVFNTEAHLFKRPAFDFAKGS